jgi:hypothetical protein
MHTNGCGVGLSHGLNEACTVVRAPRLAKCSSCSQTLCGSSFAPQRKPPGTSASVCEHNSRSDWCQWDDSHFTRNGWGPDKGSVRAGGKVVVRACGITSSADESNRIVEETCQNELSSALCKLLLQGSTGVGPMEPRVSQKRGVLKNQGSR